MYKPVKFVYHDKLCTYDDLVIKFQELNISDNNIVVDSPPSIQLTIEIDRIFMANFYMAMIDFSISNEKFTHLDYRHLNIVNEICKGYGTCNCNIGSLNSNIIVYYTRLDSLNSLLYNKNDAINAIKTKIEFTL